MIKNYTNHLVSLFCSLELQKNDLNNTLSKHLKFQTYMESISFINKIAKKADQLNHHPDMIVGWCTIKISFTSHDEGGVTQRCIEKAKFVNSLV